MTTNYEELEKLARLKEQWILSDEEFEIEKKKILNWKKMNQNYFWEKKYWLNRLWFNLIFIFIFIPLILLNSMWPMFDNTFWSIGVIILIIISIFRFKNLWMSGWYSLWLIVPIWSLYLLFLLIFKENNN